MWVLIAIAAVAVLLGLVWFFAVRSGKTPVFEPMSVGMVVGGIIGIVVGILLVEFAGFEYPFPFILWMLGMAAGQIIGLVYKRKVNI